MMKAMRETTSAMSATFNSEVPIHKIIPWPRVWFGRSYLQKKINEHCLLLRREKDELKRVELNPCLVRMV